MSTKKYSDFKILYVDDEEQALKYFVLAYEADFNILTATNVDDALGLIETDGSRIGVLITDQRMPGKTGVNLLERIRQDRPEIVRILTTAYADMDSAIEAVNAGAIYKYIVKPWNVRDLRGVLLRAMDYFTVQHERNLLLREKLSVLQRIIVADRVHSLSVLATGLAHQIRNSTSALSTFLELAPSKLRQEVSDSALKNPEFWKDMWSLALQENHRILQLVQHVADATVAPSYNFGGKLSIAELLKPHLSGDVTVQGSIPIGEIACDSDMLPRMLAILLKRAARLSNSKSLQLNITAVPDVWSAPGFELRISTNGPAWDEKVVASIFTAFAPAEDDPTDLGLELLAAFFIAHHHGGDISISKNGQAGFLVRIPFNPLSSKRAPLEQNAMEKLLLRFEREDS